MEDESEVAQRTADQPDTVTIYDYLDDVVTVQLAIVQGRTPWVASVYFVVDTDLGIYWLSWPERRHSRAIESGSEVAAACVVKADQPVIGVQMSGTASEVHDDATIRRVMTRYVAKYGQGERFADAHAAGTNHHRLYKLTPREVQLFDEAYYPGKSPVAIVLD